MLYMCRIDQPCRETPCRCRVVTRESLVYSVVFGSAMFGGKRSCGWRELSRLSPAAALPPAPVARALSSARDFLHRASKHNRILPTVTLTHIHVRQICHVKIRTQACIMPTSTRRAANSRGPVVEVVDLSDGLPSAEEGDNGAESDVEVEEEEEDVEGQSNRIASVLKRN